jgi:hypothetical protein
MSGPSPKKGRHVDHHRPDRARKSPICPCLSRFSTFCRPTRVNGSNLPNHEMSRNFSDPMPAIGSGGHRPLALPRGGPTRASGPPAQTPARYSRAIPVPSPLAGRIAGGAGIGASARLRRTTASRRVCRLRTNLGDLAADGCRSLGTRRDAASAKSVDAASRRVHPSETTRQLHPYPANVTIA